MATLTFNVSLNMQTFGGYDLSTLYGDGGGSASITEAGARAEVYYRSGFYHIVLGSGFTGFGSASFPSGGTTTGWEFGKRVTVVDPNDPFTNIVQPVAFWTFGEMSVPSSDLGDAVGGGGASLGAYMPTVLAGNDLIKGSNYDDHLLAYEGVDRLYGNGGNDRLEGGSGNDVLDGGAAADTTIGGAGDDTHIVNDPGDLVGEAAGEGTADRVFASVSYVLSGDSHVEILSTNSNVGTGAIGLTGNGFANSLLGNAGANLLNGGGGSDRLNGLGGNDIFVVDDNSDRVVEVAGGGSDRVLASGHYVLRTGVHVELLATFAPAGTAGLRLTGNELANTVHGNAGGNILRGDGGADILNGFAGNDWLYGGTGKDLMTGGTGLDRFYFDTALSAATNVGTISDFNSADDAIYLDRAVFREISADGVLDGAAFRSGTAANGTAASDPSDRIIYHTDTGRIYYDADGVGPLAQTLFARVDPDTVLMPADFVAFSSLAEAPPPPAAAFAKWAAIGEAALTARAMLPVPEAQWADVQIA
jgi:Ca2+-binding RTX toxin-like protein